MRPAAPVLVLDLFPEERAALLEVLRSIMVEEWRVPSPCPGWSVGDIALHLLGDDLNILSRARDSRMQGQSQEHAVQWDELVARINASNQRWVEATRFLSPRVVADLLETTGEWTLEYFSGPGSDDFVETVSWAGPGPAPSWLWIAREYTERWTHQQQIRDALRRPGLREARFFAPVLATFMRALPRTYEQVEAQEGTTIEVRVTGDAGGTWSLRREEGRWQLYEGAERDPQALVRLEQDAAWRLFTRALDKGAARRALSLEGDDRLGRQVLDAVAIIA